MTTIAHDIDKMHQIADKIKMDTQEEQEDMHKEHDHLSATQRFAQAIAAYRLVWQELIDLVGSEDEALRLYEEEAKHEQQAKAATQKQAS